MPNFDGPEQGTFYLCPEPLDDAVAPPPEPLDDAMDSPPEPGPQSWLAEGREFTGNLLRVGCAIGMLAAVYTLGSATIKMGEYFDREMAKIDGQELAEMGSTESQEEREAIAKRFDKRRERLKQQVAQFSKNDEINI